LIQAACGTQHFQSQFPLEIIVQRWVKEEQGDLGFMTEDEEIREKDKSLLE